MEGAISAFCQSLSSFCHHAHSASQSLADSVQRRPIPLDSAASTFLQCLDRRVASAGADLDLLDSMALGTVSFEELLGHCNQVFQINQKLIDQIQDRFIPFGYVPVKLELEDLLDDESGFQDSKFESPADGGFVGSAANYDSVSVLQSTRKKLEEDSLFEDSVSLQNLGLSDACLATLASEGDDFLATSEKTSRQLLSICSDQLHGDEFVYKPLNDISNNAGLLQEDCLRSRCASKIIIQATKNDYDSLPSYMKSLATWEELQEAIAKMNSYLSKDLSAKASYAFSQDDLEALGMGRKGRSYLLILLRINQLVVETIDGCIFYKTRAD